MPSPIAFADVLAARERLAPYLVPTPLREYPQLNELVGHDIRVWVKHENHHPTQSFKIRNGLSAVTALTAAERARGAIGASTGNHGQGVAYAGKLLGIPVAICVPERNNPEKNAAMRALGAELIETGVNYDATVVDCGRIRDERGMTLVHSTNNVNVIAGAGTMTLEIIEQEPSIDAIIIALGGGSQAVGALTVVGERAPHVKVYAAGAEGAPAQYESWRQGTLLSGLPINTFAEGIGTGSAYEFTFDALKAGLADFVTVTEDAMYGAVRDLIRITHNVPEGAGAAGLAGLRKLAPQLAGKRVAIVMCGGNLAMTDLKRALSG
ncbi:MAG: pyridoxal-phosphate dependent enzyme [Gemmatimonadetes bacterium]|nr:pyridoxal-phosphate dependent enzyme [Gemmatimonadota bacterium]